MAIFTLHNFLISEEDDLIEDKEDDIVDRRDLDIDIEIDELRNKI